MLPPQQKQADTIRDFRDDKVNLLISTSVAEEGLDIPECNLVVRYGLLTNEIAQLQASGRARAKESRYSVVADKGGKEVRRELTNECLEKLSIEAIAKVQQMSTPEFRTKVRGPRCSVRSSSCILLAWCFRCHLLFVFVSRLPSYKRRQFV